MRALRICGCWLLLLPLLGVDCCDSKKVADDNSNSCTVNINMVSTAECTVTFGGCPPDPQRSDRVMVNLNDKVTWSPSGYLINFRKDKTPFHLPDGTPVTAISSGSPAQTTTGDDACNNSGTPEFCIYKYSVTEESSNTLCSDPGVRVVPPSLFLKLLHCLRSLVHSGK